MTSLYVIFEGFKTNSEPIRKVRYATNLIQFSDGSHSNESTDWDTFNKADTDANSEVMVSEESLEIY